MPLTDSRLWEISSLGSWCWGLWSYSGGCRNILLTLIVFILDDVPSQFQSHNAWDAIHHARFQDASSISVRTYIAWVKCPLQMTATHLQQVGVPALDLRFPRSYSTRRSNCRQSSVQLTTFSYALIQMKPHRGVYTAKSSTLRRRGRTARGKMAGWAVTLSNEMVQFEAVTAPFCIWLLPLTLLLWQSLLFCLDVWVHLETLWYTAISLWRLRRLQFRNLELQARSSTLPTDILPVVVYRQDFNRGSTQLKGYVCIIPLMRLRILVFMLLITDKNGKP